MATINSENIVGIKEIGDLFGVKSPAVVNLRNRHTDFPLPIKILESGPVFDLSEIQEWGVKHNRTQIKNTVPIEYGDHKSIAFVGLPRTGKSYSSSVFAANHECFTLRRAFSGAGDDFTQCAVKIIVSSKITEPFAQFHTPNEEERRYSRIDEESLKNFVTETNEYLKRIRESGNEITPAEYIEIFVPPSQIAAEIMSENNLSYLIITDTPGVSGSYELVQIAEAHLVILVLADSGGETAKAGFKKIVEGIAPLVAAGDACFLYNLKKPCDDEDEYKDMQLDAETAMQSFEREFAPLRKSIIETSMNILHPSKSVLGVPGMKDKSINRAEELFRQRLKIIITRSLSGEGLDLIISELKGLLTASEQSAEDICDHFVDYQKEVLSQIPRLESNLGETEYFDKFKKENHARVKTQDAYRIVNAVSFERSNSLQRLYQAFSVYTVENTPDLIHQAAIKLFYRLISESIKSNSGFSNGIHPWEDYPPITMRAIEYIFAFELEQAFKYGTDDVKRTYCDTLIKNGIVSNSWNCVRVDSSKLYLLSVLTNCGVLSLHSSNIRELIRNRYIGGLRKIGEHNAWEQCLKVLCPNGKTEYLPDNLIRETGI